MSSDDFDTPLAGRAAESGSNPPGAEAGDSSTAAEDEAPDWSKLALFTKALSKRTTSSPPEPFIPRRGEKDFEPLPSDPNQSSALQASREALFAALEAGSRQHSSKAHNRAIWYPEEGRAAMEGGTHGVHFMSMARWSHERKRVELRAEEALYLVERGQLECLRLPEGVQGEKGQQKEGVTMSVQQCFAEMVGRDGLTLEKYQVYAYLRRLGYSVLRAPQSDSTLPSSTRFQAIITHAGQTFVSSLRVLLGIATFPIRILSRLRPGPSSRSLLSGRRWSSYDSVFDALRIVPSGYSQPVPRRVALPSSSSSSSSSLTNPHSATSPAPSPYQIFYHVYKPVTKYKKSAPPPPDFYVAVINARKTPIPNFFDLSDLFEKLPLPPQSSLLQSTLSRLRSLFSFSSPTSSPSSTQVKKDQSRRRPQGSIAKIKNGRRTVIIAVVDQGVVSLYKFSETDFGPGAWVGEESRKMAEERKREWEALRAVDSGLNTGAAGVDRAGKSEEKKVA